MKKAIFLSFIALHFIRCDSEKKNLNVQIYQTSAAGNQLTLQSPHVGSTQVTLSLDLNQSYQRITGFGGAFTESSAHLLNQLSPKKREEILKAYFSEDGAQYSLTRTHMNSCDFSIDHYSYAPVAEDTLLTQFSIDEDRDDIIPMIKDAQALAKYDFKLVASPWTAPPWMKDNNDWYGGKLKKEYYPTWATFFSKYAKAYHEEGIDIWAFTIENEPLGNDLNWESMHYTPEETADFVKHHLFPTLSRNNQDIKLLVYDQNRDDELIKWSDVLLTDPDLLPMIYGTAVHWYAGTVDWFPEALDYTHELAPNKPIINTEACVDAEVPHWQDDAWYWKKEATDWGWDYADEEDKPDHPKYVPVYRYARDIIGCLNHWVEGWIDWNMVLDENGGPNLASNWCTAPVIVDVAKDEVYYTPLYYAISHFSKFIQPQARRIGFECSDADLMCTAVLNPDGSAVVIVLNTTEQEKQIELTLNSSSTKIAIDKQAIQTIVINP